MRSLDNKTPKVTVPERIWAAPPYDDPGWETGAGEWDVSENWAAEGKECFIHLDLHQAEVAAAYERAADVCFDPKYKAVTTSDWVSARTAGYIRTLATPDQTSALDTIRAEARAQGMREAAVICRNVGFKDHPDSVAYDADFQVLDAITKGAKA